MIAQSLELLWPMGLRTDVAHRQDIVHRPPVGIIHNAVPIISFRLARSRSACDDANRIDPNIPADATSSRLHLLDVRRGFLERYSVGYIAEQRIAITNGKCL